MELIAELTVESRLEIGRWWTGFILWHTNSEQQVSKKPIVAIPSIWISTLQFRRALKKIHIYSLFHLILSENLWLSYHIGTNYLFSVQIRSCSSHFSKFRGALLLSSWSPKSRLALTGFNPHSQVCLPLFIPQWWACMHRPCLPRSFSTSREDRQTLNLSKWMLGSPITGTSAGKGI